MSTIRISAEQCPNAHFHATYAMLTGDCRLRQDREGMWTYSHEFVREACATVWEKFGMFSYGQRGCNFAFKCGEAPAYVCADLLIKHVRDTYAKQFPLAVCDIDVSDTSSNVLVTFSELCGEFKFHKYALGSIERTLASLQDKSAWKVIYPDGRRYTTFLTGPRHLVWRSKEHDRQHNSYKTPEHITRTLRRSSEVDIYRLCGPSPPIEFQKIWLIIHGSNTGSDILQSVPRCLLTALVVGMLKVWAADIYEEDEYDDEFYNCIEDIPRVMIDYRFCTMMSIADQLTTVRQGLSELF